MSLATNIYSKYINIVSSATIIATEDLKKPCQSPKTGDRKKDVQLYESTTATNVNGTDQKKGPHPINNEYISQIQTKLRLNLKIRHILFLSGHAFKILNLSRLIRDGWSPYLNICGNCWLYIVFILSATTLSISGKLYTYIII